ncbi:MAG: hypothetical protein OEX77_10560 [Candidatus Bathyarchaeota archaeon]|nr:hypothetical protein [Candidatus Bathyarchaeota archaeon]
MGFKKPLRELDLGEILGKTFSLYSSRFLLFYLPFLVAGLITGAWGEAVRWMFPEPAAPPPTAPPDVLLSYFFSMLGVLAVTLPLTILVSWIIDTIVRGIAVKVASDILEGRSVDLSKALNFTATRLLSLLGAGIVTGVLIVMGLICLVVPGIILVIMFSLVVPVIILEQAGTFQSLSRSRKMVGGRWLKTFALLLIVYIIITVASFIFVEISGVGFRGPARWIVSSVLGALVSPILPIAVTLYYYSMVAREQPPSPLLEIPEPTPPAAQPSFPGPPAKIHCVYCGAENEANAVICRKCGMRIVKPT